MKKKLWGVLVALLAFLFIAGCGTQKRASARTAKPEERIQAVNYQNLTKKEKTDMEFKFKAVDASYDYAIDMTVKNDSDRDVKFHLASFMILDPNNSDFQINSSLNKIITVKSGQEFKVGKLFEHITQSELEGSSSYYYLNKNYHLGYLKDTSNIVQRNSGVAATTKTASSSVSVSVVPSKSSAASASIYKASTDQQPAVTGKQAIITDPEQAVALYKHAMALAGRNDIKATPVNGGFNVYSTEDPSVGNNFIAYDGNTVINGVVTPYSQAAKQTYNGQPDDGQFNPSNY